MKEGGNAIAEGNVIVKPEEVTNPDKDEYVTLSFYDDQKFGITESLTEYRVVKGDDFDAQYDISDKHPGETFVEWVDKTGTTFDFESINQDIDVYAVFEHDTLAIEKDDNGYVIKGLLEDKKDAKDIQIPNYATEIEDYAFLNDVGENKGIETITFESDSSLTRIGDFAFVHNSIGKIEIPSSVTYMGQGVFMGNDGLANPIDTTSSNTQLANIVLLGSAKNFHPHWNVTFVLTGEGNQANEERFDYISADSLNGVENITLDGEIENISINALQATKLDFEVKVETTVSLTNADEYYFEIVDGWDNAIVSRKDDGTNSIVGLVANETVRLRAVSVFDETKATDEIVIEIKEAKPNTVQVNFDTASLFEVESQELKVGDYIKQPNVGYYMDGQKLIGWSRTASENDLFDFENSPITQQDIEKYGAIITLSVVLVRI